MERILEIKITYWERALAEVGPWADVLVEADDLGGQERTLFSPRTYRELVKPLHRELFTWLHAHTGAKVFFHTCGAVRELIPDLIEIGVDILNPVQVSAANMDTAELKREFGRDIVFWGGGVDTQRVLGSGTPAEVREEVLRRVGDLRGDGGYVVAPPSVHACGELYRWERSPDVCRLAPLPAWLLRAAPDGGTHRGHPLAHWRGLLREGVAEGERNNAIASLAGHLLWRGVDPEVTAELLLSWNATRCRPPLPVDEVLRTVDSIVRLHQREQDEDA
jgi:hypothetical protein